jgi:hypothetical protein
MFSAVHRISIEMPITWLNPAAATMDRETDLNDETYNAGEYYNYYIPGLLAHSGSHGSLLGMGGTGSMKRAMKVPAGLISLAHDSSVGGNPHNLFHVAFGDGTWEGRRKWRRRMPQDLGQVPMSLRFIEQRVFLLRHPILQTLTDLEDMRSEDVMDLEIMGSSIFNRFPSVITDRLKVHPDDQFEGLPLKDCAYRREKRVQSEPLTRDNLWLRCTKTSVRSQDARAHAQRMCRAQPRRAGALGLGVREHRYARCSAHRATGVEHTCTCMWDMWESVHGHWLTQCCACAGRANQRSICR